MSEVLIWSFKSAFRKGSVSSDFFFSFFINLFQFTFPSVTMSDEEDNAFDVEDYNKLKKEVESWKAKCKSMELKKREAELALNKIKTEINSLRSVDKLWKDSAKTVYLNLNDVKKSLDVQVDQILDGLTAVSKGGERVTEKSSHLRSVKRVIAQLQHTISGQSETIAGLNSRIRGLTAELKEKTDKCERLSQALKKKWRD
jgi:chromosome segregation ATPase